LQIGPDEQHSVFSYYLLHGIQNRRADDDGLVSAEELFVYAAPRAENFDPDAEPQEKDNYPGELLLHSVQPPQNLAIDNNGEVGEHPELSWDAAWGVTNYKVYRSSGSWQLITTTTNTYYTDNSVTMAAAGDSTKFQYKVITYFDGVESLSSNIATTWGTDYLPKITVNTEETNIPLRFELNQNYPNPFNPITTISYHIPENAHVKITVYNMRGQVVANLVNNEMSAGYYSVTWNAMDQPSGIYFCKMETRGYVSVKKLMLVK